MNLVLVVSILLLVTAAVLSFYRFQSSRLRLKASRNTLASPTRSGGLFADQTSSEAELHASKQTAKLLSDARAALLLRADEGDWETLREAARFDADKTLYGDVLNKLVAPISDDAEQLRALAEFIAHHEELRANRQLAERLIECWQTSPDKVSTACVLHTAALADDAEIYNRAVEALQRMWRDKRLLQMSAADLCALVESEYWMLAARARGSGAGFVLKQTIARVRRELPEAASGE